MDFTRIHTMLPADLLTGLSNLNAQSLDPDFFKHLEVLCKKITSIPIDQPCWSSLVKTLIKLMGSQIIQKEKFVPIVKLFQPGLMSSNPFIRHTTWSMWLYLIQCTLSNWSTDTYTAVIMKILVLPLNKTTQKIMAEPQDFIQLKIDIVKEFLKVSAILNFDATYRIIETFSKLFYGPDISLLCYSEDICQQISQLYLDMFKYSETLSCTILLTSVIDKALVCVLHSISPGEEREQLILSLWEKACKHFKDVRCPTLYLDTVKSENTSLYGRFSPFLSVCAPASPGTTVNRDFIPMKMISTLAVTWELTGKQTDAECNPIDDTISSLPRNLEVDEFLELMRMYITEHEESKYMVYILCLLCHKNLISGNDSKHRSVLLELKNKIRPDNVSEKLFLVCLDVLSQNSPVSSSVTDVWIFLITYYTELVSDGVINIHNATSEEEESNAFKVAHRLLLFSLQFSWNEKLSKVWRKSYAGLSNYAALHPMTRDEDFAASLLSKVGTSEAQTEARAHLLFTMLTLKSTSGYKEIRSQLQDNLVVLIRKTTSVPTLDAIVTLLFTCVTEAPTIAPLVAELNKKLNDDKVNDRALTTRIMKLQRDLKQHRQPDVKLGVVGSKPAASPRTSSRFLQKLSQQQQQESKASKTPPSPAGGKATAEIPASPKPLNKSKLNKSVHEDGDSQDYVFIPPSASPLVLPLTAHQKEKFKSRSSDIPALYQDLSQNSLNSQDLNSQDCFTLVPAAVAGSEIKTNGLTGNLNLDENAMDLFTPTPSIATIEETKIMDVEETLNEINIENQINKGDVVSEEKVTTRKSLKRNVEVTSSTTEDTALPMKTRRSLGSELLKENSGERTSSPNKKKSKKQEEAESFVGKDGDRNKPTETTDKTVGDKEEAIVDKVKSTVDKIRDEEKDMHLRRSPRKSDVSAFEKEEEKEQVLENIINKDILLKNEEQIEFVEFARTRARGNKDSKQNSEKSDAQKCGILQNDEYFDKSVPTVSKNDSMKTQSNTEAKSDTPRTKKGPAIDSAHETVSMPDVHNTEVLRTPVRQLSKRKCSSPFNTKDFIVELTPKRRKSAPGRGSQDSQDNSQTSKQTTETKTGGLENEITQMNEKVFCRNKSLPNVETRKSVGKKELEMRADDNKTTQNANENDDGKKSLKEKPRKSILKSKRSVDKSEVMNSSDNDDLPLATEEVKDFISPLQVASSRRRRDRKSILKLPKSSKSADVRRKSVKFHATVPRSNTTMDEEKEKTMKEKDLEEEEEEEEEEEKDKAFKEDKEKTLQEEKERALKEEKENALKEEKEIALKEEKENALKEEEERTLQEKKKRALQKEKEKALKTEQEKALLEQKEKVLSEENVAVIKEEKLEYFEEKHENDDYIEVSKASAELVKAIVSPRKLQENKTLSEVTRGHETLISNSKSVTKDLPADQSIATCEFTTAEKSRRSHNVTRQELNIRKRTIQELYSNITFYRANQVNIADIHSALINRDPLRAYDRFKDQILYNSIKFLLSDNIIYAVTDLTLYRMFGPNAGLNQDNTVIGRGKQHCTIGGQTTMFDVTRVNETLGKTLASDGKTFANDRTCNETNMSMVAYRQMNADTKLNSRCLTHMLLKKNEKSSFNFISNFSFIILSHSVDLNITTLNLAHLWSHDKLTEILKYFTGLNSVPIFLITVLTDNKSIIDKKFKVNLAKQLKRCLERDEYFVKYLDYSDWKYKEMPSDFNIYEANSTLIRIENVKFNFYVASEEVDATLNEQIVNENANVVDPKEQDVTAVVENRKTDSLQAEKKADTPEKDKDHSAQPSDSNWKSMAAPVENCQVVLQPDTTRNVDSLQVSRKVPEEVESPKKLQASNHAASVDLTAPQTQDIEEANEKFDKEEKSNFEEDEQNASKLEDTVKSPGKGQNNNATELREVSDGSFIVTKVTGNVSPRSSVAEKEDPMVTQVPDTQPEDSQKDVSSEPSSLDVVESSQELSTIDPKSPVAKFAHSTPFPTKIVPAATNIVKPLTLSSSEGFNSASSFKSVNTLERAVVENSEEKSSKSSLHSPRRSVDSPRMSRIFPPSLATPPRSPRKSSANEDSQKQPSAKKTTPPVQLGRAAAMLDLLESGSGSLLKKRITPTRVTPSGPSTANSQSPPLESPKSSRRSNFMLSLVKAYANERQETPEQSDINVADTKTGPTTPRQTRWKEQQWTPGRTPSASILRVFSSGKKKLKVNFMEHPVTEELHFDKSKETLNNSLHILYNSPVVGKKLQFPDPDDAEETAVKEEKNKELKDWISETKQEKERRQEKRRKSIDRQDGIDVDEEQDNTVNIQAMEKQLDGTIFKTIALTKVCGASEVRAANGKKKVDEGSKEKNVFGAKDKTVQEAHRKSNEQEGLTLNRNCIASSSRTNESSRRDETFYLRETRFDSQLDEMCFNETTDALNGSFEGFPEVKKHDDNQECSTISKNHTTRENERSPTRTKPNLIESSSPNKMITSDDPETQRELDSFADEYDETFDCLVEEIDEVIDSQKTEAGQSVRAVTLNETFTIDNEGDGANEKDEVRTGGETLDRCRIMGVMNIMDTVDQQTHSVEMKLSKEFSPVEENFDEKKSPVKVDTRDFSLRDELHRESSSKAVASPKKRTVEASSMKCTVEASPKKRILEASPKKRILEASPEKQQTKVFFKEQQEASPKKLQVEESPEKQQVEESPKKTPELEVDHIRRSPRKKRPSDLKRLQSPVKRLDTLLTAASEDALDKKKPVETDPTESMNNEDAMTRDATTSSSTPGISLDVSALALSYQSQSQGSLASQCGLLPTPPSPNSSLSPLYPNLLWCEATIDDVIMIALSADLAQRQLLAKCFSKLGIQTVGHLASLTRLQVNNLPLGQHKESTMVSALRAYEAKLVEKDGECKPSDQKTENFSLRELENLSAELNKEVELEESQLEDAELEAHLQRAVLLTQQAASLTVRIMEKREQLKRKREEEIGGGERVKRRRSQL